MTANAMTTRDLGQDEHHLQHAVDPVPQRVQPVPDDLGGERAVRVGEHPGVDLRAPVEQQRRDDQEDHAEDDPGGAGVRAEEPRLAAFVVRVVPEPDDGEGDDPGQHADGEQVLDEPDEGPVPDAGDRERPGEQRAVGLDDRQQQDDEAPERGRVRRARAPTTSAACAARSPRWPGPPRPGRDARGPRRPARARAAR